MSSLLEEVLVASPTARLTAWTQRARLLAWPNVFSAPFFLVLIGLSALLFARHPATNFVYDEQEALLANPFLNGAEPVHRVFHLDFWGLPPERTIGSYRPLVSLVWKGLAFTLAFHTPYYFSIVNLLLHAFSARLVGILTFEETGSRPTATLASLASVSLALSTEAVSGVVGLADVMVTVFALLSLRVLLRMRGLSSISLTFLLTLCGFFSKETMIGVLPVLMVSLLGSERPRWEKGAGFVALIGALVASVVTRRVCFPVATRATDPVLSEMGSFGALISRAISAFAQPGLPVDPINNPLLGASVFVRLSTAAELYARSFFSIFFPVRLSGDYSFSETVPHGFNVYSLFGTAILSLLLGLSWLSFRRKQRLAGIGFLWVLLTSLPTANFLLLLPTVRAERLWYLPCAGLIMAIATLASKSLFKARALYFVVPFLIMQAVFARHHANDFRDDVAFWKATATNAPRSAKAHLNLGVMLGARGDSDARVRETRIAVELAPNWAMGHVYLADILCRIGRTEEAFPHYIRGFELGPDQKSLIALGVQCLWDKKAFVEHADELLQLSSRYPASWLSYLVNETVRSGEENDGIPKEYRPRGYNERGVSGKSSQ